MTGSYDTEEMLMQYIYYTMLVENKVLLALNYCLPLLMGEYFSERPQTNLVIASITARNNYAMHRVRTFQLWHFLLDPFE